MIKQRAFKFPFKDASNYQESNAFLYGVLFNQGQSAEKSWYAPLKLFERFGTADPANFALSSYEKMTEVIARPPALHRFPRTLAKQIVRASQHLVQHYAGDARNIWYPALSLTALKERLLAIPGIAEHKAAVAVFLLTIELGVKVYDDGTKLNILMRCPGLYKMYYPLEEPILASRSRVKK